MPGGAKTNANGLAFEAKVDLRTFDGIWFERFEVQSASQYGFLKMVPTKLQDSVTDWNDRKADTGIMITNMRNGMRSFLIIEKKFQQTDGSVDSKFLAGKAFREIWTRTLDVPGNNLHEVRYAFVVNDWVYKNIILASPFTKSVAEFERMAWALVSLSIVIRRSVCSLLNPSAEYPTKVSS
jgi:hypothetical protein